MTAAAERQILGAVLSGYDPRELDLRSTDFWEPLHEQIWLAATRTADRGQRVEPTLVLEAMTDHPHYRQGTLGSYLAELFAGCSLPANAPHHAETVRRTADLRAVRTAAEQILAAAAEPDADPAQVADQGRALLDSSLRVADSHQVGADELYAAVVDQAQHGVRRGIATPWTEITNRMNGLVPGRFYIVAARPGQGKSVFCQNVAEHAALLGKGVLFCSLEMSGVELGTRITASRAEVDLGKLQRGGALDEREWGLVDHTKLMSQLRIDETPSQSVAYIRRAARTARRRLGSLDLVVIDYLQLMTPTDPRVPREQQVSQISRGLKLLAKELDVPFLVAAQLNRGPEARSDKKPMLSDLRESGSLEADADLVWLLRRGENEEAWLLEVNAAKNRHGPMFEVDLNFWGHYSQIRT